MWRKPKSEISKQDYAEFYRHLGHMFDEPWATIHWRAEGTLEFSALLFIPASKPFMPVEEVKHSKVRLHVKRMFITDEAKLLPDWLSFVVGIVDTEDLPLNVSREILQSTPVLDKIRKALVNRVLSELKSRAKDAEDFKTFQENFGETLKHGLYDDTGHGAEIAALFRFESTKEAATTLDEYIARMPEGQEAIYYLAGDAGSVKNSPQLEGFAAKGFEVLLFPDPIDAFWPPRLEKYKDKKLKSASQSSDLFTAAETGEDITALCAALSKTLSGKISEAVASTRLTGSPAMLVAGEFGPDLAMQRMLKRAGRPQLRPAAETGNQPHPPADPRSCQENQGRSGYRPGCGAAAGPGKTAGRRFAGQPGRVRQSDRPGTGEGPVKQILIATHNPGKLAEFASLLAPLGITALSGRPARPARTRRNRLKLRRKRPAESPCRRDCRQHAGPCR